MTVVRCIVTALAVVLFSPTPSDATDTVVTVPTLSDLRALSLSGVPPTPDVANVQANSTVGDGGGGTFVLEHVSCTDDDGVIVTASLSGDCWLRQFSGPVHLKWYGVTNMVDTSAPDVTAQLKAALAIATAANPVPNANAASRVVDTDGMRIHVSDNGNTAGHAIDIPDDVRLTCDAPPGGTRKTVSYPDHCIVLTTGSSAYPIILNPSSTLNAMQDVRNMIKNANTAVDCDGAATGVQIVRRARRTVPI